LTLYGQQVRIAAKEEWKREITMNFARMPGIGLCIALLVSACGGPQEPPPPPPPAIEYEAVSLRPVSPRFEFVARTRAREDVEIRAQISGTIIDRPFQEGQEVAEGATLFRIDPRPYQAALNSARAQVSQAEATLNVTERNLARGVELEPQGFISDAELDQLRGNRDAAIAALDAATAAVETAQINLNYTNIEAPFQGRVGSTNLSIGDLVGPTSGPLVTLVQRDPMLVDFDVDEGSLAERMKENRERAAQGLPPAEFTPRLQLINGDLYPLTGEIDYANNRVNPSTGTVTVTARFPNPDGQLVPGQFTRILIERGESEMRVLIPQPAVLEDMQGRYVYIVREDDTVARRNVTLGLRDGIDWVVESGLEEGMRVIVNGVQKVRPGMTVAATPIESKPYERTDTTEATED
jgi:RND family efflux transporter MFP subunit